MEHFVYVPVKDTVTLVELQSWLITNITPCAGECDPHMILEAPGWRLMVHKYSDKEQYFWVMPLKIRLDPQVLSAEEIALIQLTWSCPT